jgi:hypothetical protein
VLSAGSRGAYIPRLHWFNLHIALSYYRQLYYKVTSSSSSSLLDGDLIFGTLSFDDQSNTDDFDKLSYNRS